MARVHLLAFAAVLLAGGTAFAQSSGAPLGASGTVTLTRADYDRLVDLASQPRTGSDQAPVAAALTRADIRVRVEAKAARATMRVDGQAFRDGVSKLTLIGGAVLLDARMDNRALPVASENGTHVAFVSGPSTFSATLEVGSPLTFTPGRAAFVLPVPNAGAATATIDVPGEQADVHLSTGLILRRSSINGRTIVDATLTPGAQTSVSWSTHEAAPATAATREVRMLSDVKSILSIGDAEVRLISLMTATVVAGEPAQIALSIPPGYEVASVSGSSLERSETQTGGVVLYLSDPTLRRHQFLLSLERAQSGGSFAFNTAFPAMRGAQRETGEVAIEGSGTLDVTAPESPGLHRIDVRELDSSIVSVARDALMAAYRYQASTEEPPMLALDVHRYADAPVLSAVAERATVTTLVTVEGRALTEITLWLRNRAQRYMKVDLPQGASIVSVEVDGSPAKPVEGADGSRIPIVRPGPSKDDLYSVSFVYLHAGTPFLKKGDARMTLPKMDVPIDVVEWELFVPEQFKIDHFDGNLIDANLLPVQTAVSDGYGMGIGKGYGSGVGAGSGGGVAGVAGVTYGSSRPLPMAPQSGQIAGVVVDEAGGVIPGASVTIANGNHRQTLITDANGNYIASNVPSGAVTITTELHGFKTSKQNVQFDQTGRRVDSVLRVGDVTETVTVRAEAPVVEAERSSTTTTIRPGEAMPEVQKQQKKDQNESPSLNVQNLQRRAAGVLPVRIDVPRAGTAHRFVKPLVVDEQTEVTFRYKRR
jgi:carboxypeptidase family protein